MQPTESNPYRASEATERFTLQEDERASILAAGRWMVISGAIGTAGALAKLPGLLSNSDSLMFTGTGFLLPLAFAVVTLVAGRVLQGLKTPSSSGDQRSIAKSLDWLYLVFVTKGVIALIVMGLFALAFVAPLVFAL